VFCGEQGVSKAAERDGRDGDALQLVAFESARLVGTCRLLLDDGVARLGRMAVEPASRGHGLGAALLEAAEREARIAGASQILLAAQAAAEPLYARGGFDPRGARFFEEGIEHVTMEKQLA
jgi:predicted GNAT family N-acyltransferase